MADEKEKRSRKDKQREELESRIAKLAQLRGNEFLDEITGHVYREVVGSKRSTLPPVDNFLEDHEFGLMYGPGKYQVVYTFVDPMRDDEEKDEKSRCTIYYNIGPEYAQLHREHCAQSGQPCFLDARTVVPGMFQGQAENSLMSLLNEDKMKGLLGMLALVKSIFGGDSKGDYLKDQADQNFKLLTAVLTKGQSSSPIPEQLMSTMFTKLLDGPQQVNPAKLIKDQMDLFQTFEGFRNPGVAAQRAEEEEERLKTPIEKMIDKAMDYLPVFLERFNGDERKAATQLKREHPEAQMLLRSKSAQKAFYDACLKKHGQLSADNWAAGLGLNPLDFHSQQEQQTTVYKGLTIK